VLGGKINPFSISFLYTPARELLTNDDEMTETEKRSKKRINTPRMALISSEDKSHAVYIEDISASGASLHLADKSESEGQRFENGEQVDVMIDEISPVKGRVVRVEATNVIVEFTDLDEAAAERLATELMDRQEKFGLFELEEDSAD